jgi:hypothetical protein
MHEQIRIAGGELSPIWPPLIFEVVNEFFLIVVVLHKLVLGCSELLRCILAVVIYLALHEVIAMLLNFFFLLIG